MLLDHVRLRFVKAHGVYRRGDVIEYPKGPAKSLLIAGICEIVRQEPQLLETATIERRDVETTDMPRRRGRKAK